MVAPVVCGGMRRVQESKDIGCDHPSPILRICSGDGTEQHQASAIDEDIEPSPLFLYALNPHLHLLLIRHIHAQSNRLSSRLFNAFDQSLRNWFE